MRSFRDGEGNEWDVMVGRESWGMLVLLFSSRRGSDNRTSPLAAETAREAERELEALDEDTLRERLADSAPWSG